VSDPGKGEQAIEARVRDLLAADDRPGAATAAIQELGPSVLRYLRSLLRDEDDASDAFSVFAENVWRGLPSWRGEGSLRAWSFRLAWNAAINLRNEAWRRRGRRFFSGEASALAEEIRTRSHLKVERQRQVLDKLRESLDVEEVSLLALRIDQKLSWAEIAEVAAADGERVEPAALMKRFERLKGRLAKMAKDQGLID
jgi:RNA polymerase sigma-70 factor (ECF subfamily)